MSRTTTNTSIPLSTIVVSEEEAECFFGSTQTVRHFYALRQDDAAVELQHVLTLRVHEDEYGEPKSASVEVADGLGYQFHADEVKRAHEVAQTLADFEYRATLEDQEDED